MSFEHRIVGGGRSDDGEGGKYSEAGDCSEDSRLRDVDSVESLDNLDLLADQLRDDACHLLQQFPVDQKQMMKFASQFRDDAPTDEILREHVDGEMQKCLQRIELLDLAERRSFRRRIKMLLGAIGGSAALVLTITFLIHQFWFQPGQSNQRDSQPFPVVGSSEVVALSKSLPVDAKHFSTTAAEKSVEKHIEAKVIAEADGPYLDTATTDMAVPLNKIESASIVESIPKTSQPSTVQGHQFTFGAFVRESTSSESRRGGAPVSNASVNAINFSMNPYGGIAGIANVHGGYQSHVLMTGGNGFDRGINAMPTVDQIPDVYRSATEPEMEAILDLVEPGEDGSITIEF